MENFEMRLLIFAGNEADVKEAAAGCGIGVGLVDEASWVAGTTSAGSAAESCVFAIECAAGKFLIAIWMA